MGMPAKTMRSKQTYVYEWIRNCCRLLCFKAAMQDKLMSGTRRGRGAGDRVICAVMFFNNGLEPFYLPTRIRQGK